ncbi:MAG: hypothetical protein CVV22_06905 [Ignavibacteriae bacterium HGW-Ignavibacteriae-1]|jgi:hypothetical protein|nr:MAG: hypothetical protein CVV22_06905 [Ignavibacteriae bacterium HGW-Ignavibacteriae-1]
MKQCTFLAAILFCITSSLYSQIPQTISWQGILQDADSKNLSGTFSLTVKLYDVASGGTAIWNETHSSVVIADGLVNLTLGSVTPFSINFGDEYWLEITVGTGTPLPRIKLSSVPYAMHSKTAESANETDPTWSGNANTTGTISRSGKVGIGTSSPTALLHIFDSETTAGDVLFVGNIDWTTPRNPPTSGAGTRMMWYPDKAAIRAGYISGNHWDMSNIGMSSVAMGYNTIASDHGATAFGSGTEASGYGSTAFGILTTAPGNVATAFGNNTSSTGIATTATGHSTTASGDYSFSMGYGTQALGQFSLSMGKETSALSGYEVVLGSYNTEYVPENAFGWSENDRLFVIGNGVGDFAPSNAMTVLKNGKVGIGTDNPQYPLHVNTPGVFTGIQMTTDAAGTTMSDGLIIGMQYQSNEPSNRYATVLNKENSPLLLGTNNNYQGDLTILPGGNIGIGINPPTTRLDINGQVRIRGGSPGAGKVLTSSANGTATWQTKSLELPFSSTISSSGTLFYIKNNEYLGSGIYGYGVFGVTGEAHDGGIGVGGYGGLGVEGVSKSAGGVGVYGRVQISGTAIKGKVDNPNDFSGYFLGGKFYTSSQVGIGTESPSALLHVHGTGYSGGNVVFTGEYLDSYISQAPVEGSGTRMMWYPNKGSFRAGRVTSTQWNKSNMGDYSTAFGYDTKASGYGSIALGYSSTASNTAASAIGFNTIASGNVSTAIGYSATASGYASTAIGYYATASGFASTGMGYNTTAKSGYETVVGSWNTDYTPVSTSGWNSSDRLFVIGNGTASTSRSNAMTVLKNGKIGIGTASPSELLHINNSTGTAKLRVSSASTALSELTFYSGSTYLGAIGSDNTSNYLFIYHGGNIIFKNGRIGIQTETNPTFALHLPNSTSDGTGRGRANAWTTYSDRRIKTATEEIQYGLSEIMQLQPVKYFQHNSIFDDGKLVISDIGASDIGFIAQDIFKIIPEIVSVPDNENAELWGLNYEKLTPILVKAIQEQQMKIDELERKLELLLQKFSENK